MISPAKSHQNSPHFLFFFISVLPMFTKTISKHSTDMWCLNMVYTAYTYQMAKINGNDSMIFHWKRRSPIFRQLHGCVWFLFRGNALNEICKIPWFMIKFHMFTLLFWVSSPISQQQRTARPDAAPRLCERKTGEPHSRSEKKESGRMEGFMCCHVRQVRPANNTEVSWSIRLTTGL